LFSRQAIMVDVPKSKCASAIREVKEQGGIEQGMQTDKAPNRLEHSAGTKQLGTLRTFHAQVRGFVCLYASLFLFVFVDQCVDEALGRDR